MADFVHALPAAEWAERLGAYLGSRQVLERLALQLAVIAAMLGLCWGLRRATRPWTRRLAAAVQRHFPTWRVAAAVDRDAWLLYAWLLLAVAGRTGAALGSDWGLVRIAADLAALWLILRVATFALRDKLGARVIATVALAIFALDLFGLLQPTEAALDAIGITIGTLRLSLLLIAKAALIVVILLWLATALARLTSNRIQRVAGLSPSVQLLFANLVRIALVCVAVVIGLNLVGIDLTALTVFSGAIGVGVGFGLQKIVSNFVSGIILLTERSIKPGDVIETTSTFGYVLSLGARYTAVVGRDGKEYLIPNENLITNQVVNWSYSSPLVRIDAEFGVAYASDLRRVRELAIAAAERTARVLAAPKPVCHITGFGDSAVNLVLRFWIDDPAQGVTNIKGDVYLALWDAFKENGIQFPFPQRDVHLRSDGPALQSGAAQAQRIADDEE
jgi:small-conductance mechanosensitive channel